MTLSFIPCQEFIEVVDDSNTCIAEIFFNTDVDQWCYIPYNTLSEEHLDDVLEYMYSLNKENTDDGMGRRTTQHCFCAR